MAKGKSKKVPARMCVSCREMREKKKLFRLLVEDDKIIYDPTGKKQGRGAYVCRNEDCIDKALNQGRLRHHLHAELHPETGALLKKALDELRREEAAAERGRRVVRVSADGKSVLSESFCKKEKA